LETYPWNPEVLKRPDAEHLIMGLNSGAFSLETIVHQLSNPALQVPLLVISHTPIPDLTRTRKRRGGGMCVSPVFVAINSTDLNFI
jgi:hypothetical protein